MSSDNAIPLGGEARQEHRAFLASLHAGQEAAWGEFYHQYNHRIRAYLRALWLGPEHHLDDLLQLTLLRAVKHIGKARTLPDEAAFWSWLTVLARSVVADHGRRNSRFQRFLKRFHLEPKEKARPAPAPHLEPAIEKLDPTSRRLLLLKYRDHLPVRQIAATLNLSEKAVESRLTRARNKLRKLLRP
ncbi:MAG: RNA polymerase sigma factor [Verrucomicrobiaceae bacterium]